MTSSRYSGYRVEYHVSKEPLELYAKVFDINEEKLLPNGDCFQLAKWGVLIQIWYPCYKYRLNQIDCHQVSKKEATKIKRKLNMMRELTK
jgi:hypothetical protein